MGNTGETKTFKFAGKDDSNDTLVLLIPYDYIEKVKLMINEESGEKRGNFDGIYFVHTGTFENQ